MACLSRESCIVQVWVGLCTFFFFKKHFIYLFLERGEEREKEQERNINVWLPLVHPQLGTWPATQTCSLTGNRTGDSLVSKTALNPLSHTSQYCFIIFDCGYMFAQTPSVEIL